MPDRDRLIRASDIVGAKAIAERLGLAHAQSVSVLRQRHDEFPPPVAELGKALIWAWPDVEAWALCHGRTVDASVGP